jgi:hypothetical protein
VKTYLISYDLNRPGQDYTDLIEALKRFPNWWHHLDSTWVVRSQQSAIDICRSLIRYLDDNDEILVASVQGDAAWWGFDQKGSDWLKSTL